MRVHVRVSKQSGFNFPFLMRFKDVTCAYACACVAVSFVLFRWFFVGLKLLRVRMHVRVSP